MSKTLIPVKKGDKYGYIDQNGNVCIELKFDDAGNFFDGIAMVLTSEGDRFIDQNGNFLTETVYDTYSTTVFQYGLASVGINNEQWIIDKEFTKIFPISNGEVDVLGVEIYEKLITVFDENKVISIFNHEGVLLFRKGNVLDFICTNNNYNIIRSLDDRTEYFVYDDQFNELIKNKYILEDFNNTIFITSEEASSGNEFTIRNTKFEQIVEGTFQDARLITEKYCAVEKANMWGVFDVQSNKLIVDFRYFGIDHINSDKEYLVIENEEGKCGITNYANVEILPCKFESIEIYESCCTTYYDERECVYNLKSKKEIWVGEKSMKKESFVDKLKKCILSMFGLKY